MKEGKHFIQTVGVNTPENANDVGKDPWQKHHSKHKEIDHTVRTISFFLFSR
jgi:hypothetical protein